MLIFAFLIFCDRIEHRLTEQEASDEIRSLLQNFVIQLQAVKDRIPSRGSAMTTISILLDTTKPLSNNSQISLMPPTLTGSTTIKKSGLAINNTVSVLALQWGWLSIQKYLLFFIHFRPIIWYVHTYTQIEKGKRKSITWFKFQSSFNKFLVSILKIEHTCHGIEIQIRIVFTFQSMKLFIYKI